jgi:hypothetical protein
MRALHAGFLLLVTIGPLAAQTRSVPRFELDPAAS